ncbi:hypothetical protein [Flavobacterium taihuense]|uniref:Uncharacterized protein n=1 Tax=Flavobacterium taihuense TaxID=2857508 RepID=A0ABS6XWT2_9FLAO|nr:hypothetical protein [Flavobacterium taihuense]MBW4361112.1 hypothetical protein [Flavobacterium taihuense]
MKTILLLINGLFLISQMSFGNELSTHTLKTIQGNAISFNNVHTPAYAPIIDGVFIFNKQSFKIESAKKTTIREKHRVWLNLTNAGGVFKQLLVGYITGATNGWDDLYDGISYDANMYADFYSINDGKNLTIQGRALPFLNTDEVPLGYRTIIEGTFQISIDHVDGLFINQDVFIVDKTTGTCHNLKNGSYSFTTLQGRFDDRFVLVYVDKTVAPTLPVVDEPVVTEPVVSNPVVDEPVVTDPVVTDPIVVPIVDDPVVTDPVVTDPIVVPIVDEPVVTVPVVTDPVVVPIVDEPVVTDPVVTDPVVVPIADEPVVTVPVVTDPVVVPIADEPVVTVPVVTDPVAVPIVDEPVVTVPVVTDPVVVPIVDEPVVSTPIVAVPHGNLDKNGKAVIVSVNNRQIKVNSFDGMIQIVMVYDLKGTLLYEMRAINSVEFVIQNLETANKVLVVKTQVKNEKWSVNKIVFR